MALICLVGVLPYIALQLKGIVLGVNLLIGAGADATGSRVEDTALIVTLVLALFTILFGTRNLDATEHHRGMVLAIAFESLVKLFAFLAVGAFVVWGLHGGVADVFARAAEVPEVARRLTRADTSAAYGSWGTLIFLSLFASPRSPGGGMPSRT